MLEPRATEAKNIWHVCAAVLLCIVCPTAVGQERWYQIEVSIFTNENSSDRLAENWNSNGSDLNYPERIQQLDSLLKHLTTADLQKTELESEKDVGDPSNEGLSDSGTADELLAEVPTLSARDQLLIELEKTAPSMPSTSSRLRLPDFQRDSFVNLLSDASDFRQTNRALEQAAEHRLLFHRLWRQPLTQEDQAVAIAVDGGEQFGEHRELEGSIRFYLNETGARIIADLQLWLSEFELTGVETALTPGGEAPAPKLLPELPAALRQAPDAVSEESDDESSPMEFVLENDLLVQSGLSEPEQEWRPARIYPMTQTRAMRSSEFHYLDNPALGVVIYVLPYEPPEPALSPAAQLDALTAPLLDDPMLDGPLLEE